MNWYKIAIEFDEPPEWDYPGSDSDYDPYAYYEHDNQVDAQIKQYIENFVSNVKLPIIAKADFIKDIKVAYVMDMEYMGRYFDGSRPYIIVLLDVGKVKELAEQAGNNFEEELQITILHEVAHGIQDSGDMDRDEDEAEWFAQQFVNSGQIISFWD